MGINIVNYSNGWKMNVVVTAEDRRKETCYNKVC